MDEGARCGFPLALALLLLCVFFCEAAAHEEGAFPAPAAAAALASG